MRIRDITIDDDETLRIQVRVIRMWYTKAFKNSNEINNIDIVLLDQDVSRNLLPSFITQAITYVNLQVLYE